MNYEDESMQLVLDEVRVKLIRNTMRACKVTPLSDNNIRISSLLESLDSLCLYVNNLNEVVRKLLADKAEDVSKNKINDTDKKENIFGKFLSDFVIPCKSPVDNIPPKVYWPAIKAVYGIDCKKLHADGKCAEYINWSVLKKHINNYEKYKKFIDEYKTDVISVDKESESTENDKQILEDEKFMYGVVNDLVDNVGISTVCATAVTGEKYILYVAKYSEYDSKNMKIEWAQWVQKYYNEVFDGKNPVTVYWRKKPVIKVDKSTGDYEVRAKILISDKPVAYRS